MKSLIISLVVSVLASGVFVGATQSASAANPTTDQVAAVCSTLSADYIIKENQVLLSHDVGGAVFSRTVSIPAGTYSINALSYEPQHPNDPIPGQPKEQWKINLFSAGELVFASGPTTDIPDAIKTTLTELSASITLPAIDTIQYVHYGWPEDVQDPALYVYNSVVPACVSFSVIPPVNPCTNVNATQAQKDAAKCSVPASTPGVLGASTDKTTTTTSAVSTPAVLGDSTAPATLAKTGLSAIQTSMLGLTIVAAVAFTIFKKSAVYKS